MAVVNFRVEVDTRKIRSLMAGALRFSRRVKAGMRRIPMDSAEDIERAARANALRILPRSGGLAQRVADSRFQKQRRTLGEQHVVTIVASSEYDLQGIDQGELIHPTFGRSPWVEQRIPIGWFSQPVAVEAEDFKQNIESLARQASRLIR